MATEDRLMELDREVADLRQQLGRVPLEFPKGEVIGGPCLSAELKTGEALGRAGEAQGYLIHYVKGTDADGEFLRSVGEITIKDIGKPGSTSSTPLTGGKIPTGKEITGPAAIDVTPVGTWYRLIGFDCDQLEDV